jgi:hypothetical protein
MNDNTVKILKISETAQLDVNGMLKQFISVQFNVGQHGPFMETVPKSEYNAAAFKAKLDQFAQSLAPLTNAY